MSEYRYISFNNRPRSLLGQIIGVVVGVAVLAVSFVFGAVLLTAFLGFALVIALVVVVRAWWLRRKMEQMIKDGEMPDFASASRSSPSDDGVIDADYTVIDSRKQQDK